MLPYLATFLGHIDIISTQQYLSMTPELLKEANIRFERYAVTEGNIGERQLARNTQQSYRDTLALLLPFTAAKLHRPVDQLAILDISAEIVRQFLLHLEQERKCSAVTRNQRLATIRSLARFIGERNPECLAWCGELCSIPIKKAPKPHIAYLEKQEVDAILGAPDRHAAQGFRDYALLLFLYNSGARADEAAHVSEDVPSVVEKS